VLDEEKIICRGCESSNSYKIYEPKYNGYLGKCPDCGGSWPES
jgi:hypothetical protein